MKAQKASERSISAKQARFVSEYLLDLNATQAAIRAGYSPKTAQEQASRLLSNVMVSRAVQVAMAERSERTLIDADTVLREWLDIATADPNDLIQFRRTCCASCWKPAKFDRTRDPNPGCEFCRGEGNGDTFVLDTRKLSGKSRKLYAGVKQTKDGIEIKFRDQDAALANIARHLGMFKEKVELTGKDGGPIRHEHAQPDLSNLTADELDQLEAITAKLAGSDNA